MIFSKVCPKQLCNAVLRAVLHVLPFAQKHSETNIECCKKIINSVKDELWPARNIFVSKAKKCPQLIAHFIVRKCVLRNALKPDEATI